MLSCTECKFRVNMHSVQNCSSQGEPTRSARMQRTRDALIERARALTADRGLVGFTVDELCDAVGISRRTFFNYFDSKEDAVVGDPPELLPDEKRAGFLAAGSPQVGELSSTLLADLVQLILEHAHTHHITRDQHLMFREIVRAEPHLLTRLIAASEAQQEAFAAAIAEREGMPLDHPLARVIVDVVLTVTFRTVTDFFAANNTHSFDELMHRNVAFAQQLLVQNLDTTGRS